MTIMPVVTVSPIRGGIAVEAVELRLAGHGRDRERAEAALRSAVLTWASCVARDGDLGRSLMRLGVKSDDAGNGVEVRFVVEGETA